MSEDFKVDGIVKSACKVKDTCKNVTRGSRAMSNNVLDIVSGTINHTENTGLAALNKTLQRSIYKTLHCRIKRTCPTDVVYLTLQVWKTFMHI